ncbi:polysaccharide deacetylase family protein [Kitasatospora cinereorecta]|uniref:Polysaccharide deacetylase family protein n=1 Tax=Kitasatospora cinereorecta TaxID=285560 RepID=A0ABW0VBD9_9ACTN
MPISGGSTEEADRAVRAVRAVEAGHRTPDGPAGAGGARRRAADTLLRHSPLQPAFRIRSARRLAVLAYHGVDDPASFAAQLERLTRTATPVTLDQVEQAVAEGRPLAPRSVLLTFDDGERSVLTRGLPALARHRLPAAAFVVAGHIGGDQPFWWTEAHHLVAAGGHAAALGRQAAPGAAVAALKRLPDAERLGALEELRATAARPAPRTEQLTVRDLATLRDGGVAIGNHTLTHPCLDRCADGTVRTEVAEAHQLLTGWLGAAPTAFAYPNGNLDGRVETLLRDLGYRLGFLFDHRHDALLPRNPLRISRLRVNSHTTRARFDTILSGLHPAVHRLRGGH